jgi:dephospho-CoA kinase
MDCKKIPGFKLGITGGIGSGKTSVCKVFNVLGIPSFLADPEAKLIMENDNSIMKRLNSITGKNLYAGGILDRMELARLIFNDDSLLIKVNALIHPIVLEHFGEWVKKQQAPYVIMEAAIMFESGADKCVDRVATVVAPVEERVNRVIYRNKLTREQVLDRIRNQMDDDIRIKLSHYVIHNSENDMIIPAILKIHDDILKNIKSVH